MPEIKAPGVFINEVNAFPNSVVEVPTAVPAFVGYTEKATAGSKNLTLIPTRITSMAEFEQLFGTKPSFKVTRDASGNFTAQNRFLLYQSMRFFFDNGGGACWVTSVGNYNTTEITKDVLLEGLAKIEDEAEPTKLLIPEAILLKDQADWAIVNNAMLAQCNTLQNRIAILDVYRGNEPRTTSFDPIKTFRTAVQSDDLSYGCAYYPWLNTSLIQQSDITFTAFDEATLTALKTAITVEQIAAGQHVPDDIIAQLTPDAQEPATTKTHKALTTLSTTYKDWMSQALKAINLMPPSPALAGIIARTDNTRGVWKAPANTSVNGVSSPCVAIDNAEQEDLNVPLDGKAINAIRSFTGRGILVWGARTLDGNSQDWRYINMRRSMIMLEQSIKLAAQAYVFEANDASTWTTVKTMIENFLTTQWKAGALAGTKPEEAFTVNVGLGSTMTANDVLDGRMNVTVLVALVRPAEFIVLTFTQQMQTS